MTLSQNSSLCVALYLEFEGLYIVDHPTLVICVCIVISVCIYIMENARGSPCSVLLALSQSYVKHDLRKNKIVMASTTGFFRH
jgi:hypothetical protein